MFNPDQLIEVRMHPNTKQHYESLGYKWTKSGDLFMVKAQDLPLNSKHYIDAVCDKCGKQVKIRYMNYNANVKRCGIFRCQSCVSTDIAMNTSRTKKSHQEHFQQYLDLCEQNGFIPMTRFEDIDKLQDTDFRFVCPQHGEQTIHATGIKRIVYGCKECEKAGLSKKKAADVNTVIAAIEANGNQLLNPEDYINCYTKNLRIVCGGCGKEYISSYVIQHYYSGNSSCDCGRNIPPNLRKLDLEKQYNSEQKVLLNANEYVTNTTANLMFVCKTCGDTFITSKAQYDKGRKRCKKCSGSVSVGEDIIMDFLNDNGINYDFQKRFDDCRDVIPLPFDFYLSDYNLIIEFDGPHHFMPVFGEEHYLKTKKHDKIKDDYCANNNIQVLRIPYLEGNNIGKILTKRLLQKHAKILPKYRV